MYLYVSEEQNSSLTPSSLKYIENNNIEVYDNLINKLKESKKLKEFNIKKGQFFYLNMKNTDCLIMSKNLWHASCPYLKKSNDRKSINFRVVVRNDDGSINHNGNMLYRRYNHIYKNKKLYNVNRFDLI